MRLVLMFLLFRVRCLLDTSSRPYISSSSRHDGAVLPQMEGEPQSVEREIALLENKADKDVDEDGNLVLHTFFVSGPAFVSFFCLFLSFVC